MNDDFDDGSKEFEISGKINGVDFKYIARTILLGEEDEDGWRTWDEIDSTSLEFFGNGFVKHEKEFIGNWMDDLMFYVVRQEEFDFKVEEL